MGYLDMRLISRHLYYHIILTSRFSRPAPLESQQCSQLKRQNAKLKKILRELTEIDSEVLVAGESVRSQRELQALGLRNQESHSADNQLLPNHRVRMKHLNLNYSISTRT